MKKISVLLIAFLLVASFAFAEETFTFSVSGSASVTWGIDLDTNATGFANAGSGTLEITLIPTTTDASSGSDWYGTVGLEYAAVDGFGAATVTAARITNDVVYIDIRQPGITGSNATNIFNADGDQLVGTGFRALNYAAFRGTFASAIQNVSPAIALVQGNTHGGITIGYASDPINDLSLAIVSDGNWNVANQNLENYYGIALNANATVDVLTIGNRLFLGVFADETAFGNTTSVGVDLGDTNVAVGFDLTGSSDDAVDLAWKSSLTLTQTLAEGTSLALRTTLGEVGDDMSLDLGLTFVEGTAEGFVPTVGAKLGVVLQQVLAPEEAMRLGVLFDVEYSDGGINPFAGVGFHSVLADDDTAFLAYEAGVNLRSDFHGIDNTTFTLRYGTWQGENTTQVAIDDLHPGFISFTTAISF